MLIWYNKLNTNDLRVKKEYSMKLKVRFTHFLAVAVAILMMFSTVSVLADGIGDGDWIYERTTGNNEYYIKSFTGSSDRVKIPALFQTKPVTKINDNAFLNNVVISYVEIPATVKEIGAKSFYGCKSLKEVQILGNVEVIGAHAFYGCTLLSTINIEKVADLKEIPRNCFSGCLNLKNFEVPECVETIGDRAFFDCVSLESITIPASVKSISDLAFKNCSDIIIYGYADSYAQQFAVKNNIPFALVGEEVAPTQPGGTPSSSTPTEATEPTTSTDVATTPTQEESTSTEPPQESSATDPTEIPSEGTIPSNPIVSEPEDDPFDTDPTEPSSLESTENTDSSEPSSDNNGKKKYLIGDTDLSGVVTVKDATMIQKYAASLVQLDKIQLFLANCNSTGDVNVKDATQVQKYCAGFLNIMFVGQEVEI